MLQWPFGISSNANLSFNALTGTCDIAVQQPGKRVAGARLHESVFWEPGQQARARAWLTANNEMLPGCSWLDVLLCRNTAARRYGCCCLLLAAAAASATATVGAASDR
mmetsp:Transcript_57714/g.114507  ORF Transcript_57714/g.114507 Transcript_57714/m.114507 type:complete len:108 (+) Transcript_57714:189-512(+)